MYEMSHQSRFDARYWMLGAGALGRPRGMVWGGRREEGSGWGTHVYLWRIHFNIWQNQYNIVKFKNKIKFKKTIKKKSDSEDYKIIFIWAGSWEWEAEVVSSRIGTPSIINVQCSAQSLASGKCLTDVQLNK